MGFTKVADGGGGSTTKKVFEAWRDTKEVKKIYPQQRQQTSDDNSSSGQ